MSSLQTLHVGPNSVTFEPPDTTLVVLAGEIDTSMMDQLIDQMVDVSRNKPYMLFIFNVTQLSSLSLGARKAMVSNGHRLPPRILAFFGASYTTQIVSNMMDRASARLGSKNRQIAYWPDEQSARAWAAQMRPALAANTHAQTSAL